MTIQELNLNQNIITLEEALELYYFKNIICSINNGEFLFIKADNGD